MGRVSKGERERERERQCDAIKFALGAWPALWEGGTVAESKTKLEAAAVFRRVSDVSNAFDVGRGMTPINRRWKACRHL